MIGVYNYSVILTYLGVGLSLFGITQALSGNFDIAILCLALAGACDTFDVRKNKSSLGFRLTPSVMPSVLA